MTYTVNEGPQRKRMTPSTIRNTATALRLARRDGGVTVGELQDACGITRQGAYAILRQLKEIGELIRDGGRGRGGHVYRIPEYKQRIKQRLGY